MNSSFRNLVLAALSLHAIYMILPYSWNHLYDVNTLDALSWNGWGSLVPMHDSTGWVVFSLYVIASIGLFFYKNWARIAFLLLIIVGGLLTPIWGLLVITGWEYVLLYFLTVADGAIIIMAFFTSVSRSFDEPGIG